jgi:predicted DNA-binding transcriptional regulator YafY
VSDALVYGLICGGLYVAYEIARRVRKPTTPAPTSPTAEYESAPRWRSISLSIQRRWDIEIDYIDADGERTQRRVTPQHTGIDDAGRIRWRNQAFTGFCHLRQDVRHFRYDRIVTLLVLAPNEEMRRKHSVAAPLP